MFWRRFTAGRIGVKNVIAATCFPFRRVRATAFRDSFRLCSTFAKELQHNYERIMQEFQERRGRSASCSDSINPRDVFCNHRLDLAEIEVYGFDFDFVLASYRNAIHTLIFELARDNLVDEQGYPQEIKSLQYDPSFSIRGLHFDTQKGNILKLDFTHIIETAYFGRDMLTSEQLQQAYGGRHIPVNYYQKRLTHNVDNFNISLITLLADLVQFFVNNKIPFDPELLLEDVQQAVSHLHRTQILHKAILSDLPRYVYPSPSLAHFLRRLKDGGKKLFLLTNSPFDYVDGVFRYVCSEANWATLFDVVLTRADKPYFFISDYRPFRVYTHETSAGTRGSLNWQKVTKLLPPPHIYLNGSLKQLTELTGWKGSRVLYVGDHLLNDLVDPTRYQGWRTCAVLRELEGEISTQNRLDFRALLFKEESLRKLLRSTPRKAGDTDDSSVRQLLEKLEADYATASEEKNKLYSSAIFGSPFTANGKDSMFAFQTSRYADIYTSRVENLLAYPMSTLFVPERRYLPHETPINLF